MMKMTKFESDVAFMLTSGNDTFLKYLNEQLRSASLLQRDISPNGFFLKFTVDDNISPIPKLPSFVYGDLSAEIEGLSFGAGFIIFVKDGLLDALEGYSYQEKWPTEPFKYKLYYDLADGKRDTMRTVRYSSGSWPLMDGSVA